MPAMLVKPFADCLPKIVTRYVLDCHAAVEEGKIEWTLKKLSWLEVLPCAQFQCVSVAGHVFQLCFILNKGAIGDSKLLASLAIMHDAKTDFYYNVTFRGTICKKLTSNEISERRHWNHSFSLAAHSEHLDNVNVDGFLWPFGGLL